jgi:hypothetical protein
VVQRASGKKLGEDYKYHVYGRHEPDNDLWLDPLPNKNKLNSKKSTSPTKSTSPKKSKSNERVTDENDKDTDPEDEAAITGENIEDDGIETADEANFSKLIARLRYLYNNIFPKLKYKGSKTKEELLEAVME